jgi:general secretion pathway protein A
MYRAFFQLKDEPFRLTPDPRFLHLAEPHKAALTVLLDAILHRKGLVMITGAIGTGKTTVIHTVLRRISPQKMGIRSALLFNPLLTRDEFLEMMLEEFDVNCPSTAKPGRLMALHRMLLETQRSGGTAVLFIDEAHLLSTELLEEIRLLGNADTWQEKLLQIILCGQPELLTLMKRRELSALQQRIAARVHLRPLNLAETHDYIAERLLAGGLQGPSPFPPHTLKAVFRYSGGTPRLINLICEGCLTLGFRTQRKTIQPDIVEEVAVSLDLTQRTPPGEKTLVPAAFLNLSVPTVAAASASGGAQKTVVDMLIEAMNLKWTATRRVQSMSTSLGPSFSVGAAFNK